MTTTMTIGHGARRTGAAFVFSALGAFALLLLQPAGTAHASGQFTTFDPPGSVDTYALSINAKGTIAGYYRDADNVNHGFLRTRDGTITSFDPPGSVTTYAFAINSKNVITGYYQDGTGASHGFVRDAAGTITEFDVAGQDYTNAYGINNNGMIVGAFGNPGGDGVKWHGFVRATDGTITTFGVPNLGIYAFPNINDAGAVAGTFLKNRSGAQAGFERFPDGTQMDFRAPKCGHLVTQAVAINSAGAIAGWCRSSNVDDGFLRAEDGTFTMFNVGPDTTVTGINSSNTIVGFFIPDDGNGLGVGFLRTADGAIKKCRMPEDRVTPMSVNDKGNVAGYYFDTNEIAHGFTGRP